MVQLDDKGSIHRQSDFSTSSMVAFTDNCVHTCTSYDTIPYPFHQFVVNVALAVVHGAADRWWQHELC